MVSSDGTSNRTREHAGIAVQRALDRMGSLASAPSRYALGEEMSRDHLGVCLRVWDATLERDVAMKLLHDPPAVSPGSSSSSARVEATRRFVEEAWIAGQLNHPGVVPIHEIGVDARGHSYLTMRPIDGRSFADVLACAATGREGFTRARALHVLLQVCETVAYAHGRGFIHQNLRPRNVLVGNFGETYVLEWGSALGVGVGVGVAVGAGAEVATKPGGSRPGGQANAARETGPHVAAYLAPEQVLQHGAEVGPHTDVYAIGAMLYHLLAGHAPYCDGGAKRSHDETLAWIAGGAPTPIDKCAAGAPRDLVAICAKATAREPSARYADMQSMAIDLRAHIENRVVRAHRTGALAELRKWMLRNRATAIAAALAVLVALVGLSSVVGVTSIKNRALTRAGVELQAQLDAVRRLASSKRLRDLARAADELWPAAPEQLPAMRRWHDEALALEAERPLHAASLEALIARRDPDSDAASPRFKDPVDDWWYTNLRELLLGLDALKADAPGHVGTRAEMEARMARSASLVQRSVDDHADAWAQAITAIAEDPRYGGLELSEQPGLVPIGCDPESGYFEFWHVDSGSQPSRSPATHRLLVTEESGIVLVLLPGGTFFFGSQRLDPSRPNFDPDVSETCVVRQVTLAPFFLAKFEMTQAQWLRTMGSNPSVHGPDSPDCIMVHTLLHPVTSISWQDAELAARRLGLRLPTSAQWEYAERAGTNTRYPSGDKVTSLREEGNLADESFKRFFTGQSMAVPWDDGFPCLAPVAQFRANPFGFHDMVGNNSEYCRDEFMPVDVAVDLAPDDGEQHRRVPAPSVMFRISRGATFSEGQYPASAGRERGNAPQTANIGYGVRMARAIDR